MKEEFDNCMPKEQFDFISKIQADMLESTNMTKDEAWDFGFRCWQCGYAKAEYINKSTEHINKSRDCSSGWIPCSERLPEENTRVLACFSSGTVTELAYLGEGMFSGLYEYTTKVIVAWMPLPEPYKPEKGV